MDNPPWLQVMGDGGLLLKLHVQPGAKREEVVGLHGDALKIRLKAPPVDGRANRAVVAFVARRLGIPRTAVRIRRGPGSRAKQLLVEGCSAERVCRRLAGWDKAARIERL